MHSGQPKPRAPRLELLVLAAVLLGPGSAAPAETGFRIATYNVENYLLDPIGTRPAKSPEARAKVRENLRALNADVVALQEIGGLRALQDLRETLQREGLDYPHWEWITGFDTNIQVAVLSRFSIEARRPHTNDTFLLLGRRYRVSRGFLELDLRVGPQYQFTLITTHLKSQRQVGYADEAEFREQEALLLRELVNKRLAANPKANLVVLGDFNDVKDSKPIRALIGRGNRALVDTRPSEANGDSKVPSNPRYDSREITWTYYYGLEDTYSRIDYILLSKGMAAEWKPEGTHVLAVANWGLASDHRPLVAAFVAEDR